MNARILINPRAGRGRAGARVRGLDLARRPGVTVAEPQGLDALDAAVRSALDDGVERVIVVGGDGTLHRVVQQLRGTGCALGIVPCGTGNDLAASLGIGGPVEACVARALDGPIVAIDVGDCDGEGFAVAAGVGFDAEVARRVRDDPPWIRGALAYPWVALRAIGDYRPPRVRIRHDDGEFDGTIQFAVFANAPRFGGGMRIAPEASMQDGRLDLVIVRALGTGELLRALPRVYRGTHLRHPKVEAFRTREATITVSRPTTFNGDGEPVERGPGTVRVTVRPGALRVAGIDASV